MPVQSSFPEALVGETVVLRRHRPENLAAFRRWYSDAEVARLTRYQDGPMRPEEIERFFTARVVGPNALAMAVHEKATDRLVGTCAFSQLDGENGSALYHITIGEQDAWGHGFGTEATQLMVDHAFGTLGLHRIGSTNTLPDRLGEERFAAADFLREIQAMAARFNTVRIDGPDYRHRGLPAAPRPLDPAAVRAAVERPGATLDDFSALTAHLASLHPSRFGALVDGVCLVGLNNVTPAADQNVALRLVVFVDRLYDRQIPIVAAGCPLDEVFTAEMLAGGYRKKYLRAVSRLIALTSGQPE